MREERKGQSERRKKGRNEGGEGKTEGRKDEERKTGQEEGREGGRVGRWV